MTRHDIEWLSPELGRELTVADLVPTGTKPNGLQRTAAEVALEEPKLTIIEAPTGEGKTEAAFILIEGSRRAGTGAYFALPTMATANGLYERVASYLGQAAGSAAVPRLLHSSAWLYRTEGATVPNPDDVETQAMAEDWFSGGKRGLLTHFGVGTVDQCLIGALLAKHGFVRLFALAGKAVVIDEVHAYDVYMSDLLGVLLGWLKILNCRVILLSATLPAKRRAALIHAWSPASFLETPAYPCITWLTSGGAASSRCFKVADRAVTKFEVLRPADGELWKAGADKILELVLSSGGLGALVLNTVKQAQQAAHYLKGLGVGLPVDLFHGRFTVRDRGEIESMVLRNYGKLGGRSDPRILVATQVVEQSLDLDFDHLVTALAPIDLLIQRAGRLHRHRRDSNGQLRTDCEPDSRGAAICHVIVGSGEDDLLEIENRIYAPSLLMKTEQLLRSGVVLSAAADIAEAVEHVYGEGDMEEDRAGWEQTYLQALAGDEAKQRHQKDLAGQVAIPVAEGADLLTSKSPWMDENEQAHGSHLGAKTRLQELPSVDLIIFGQEDAFPPRWYGPDVKKDLAFRTVRCTAVGQQLQELLSLPTPSGWERAGTARHGFPMKFEGKEYQTLTGTYTYDSDLGLQFTKNE